VLEEEYFRLELKALEEVVTLKEEWKVKRKVTCSFFYYVGRDLEDVAVLTSAEDVRAINGTMKRLEGSSSMCPILGLSFRGGRGLGRC